MSADQNTSKPSYFRVDLARGTARSRLTVAVVRIIFARLEIESMVPDRHLPIAAKGEFRGYSDFPAAGCVPLAPGPSTYTMKRYFRKPSGYRERIWEAGRAACARATFADTQCN